MRDGRCKIRPRRARYNLGLVLKATIWLSVLAWASSEVLRRAGADRRAAARALFTAGALLLAGHTAIAFQVAHGWSHDAAYLATAQRSAELTGFASGSGIYLNYLMMAVWAFESAWWWLDRRGYLHRARALDLAMFAFFTFMFVNGAVVFASGRMRIAGAVAVVAAVVARAGLPGARLARGRA